MKIVFLGAEVPSHRILLTDSGVKTVGVNYWRLKKRGLPKTKDYLLADRFPEDVVIHVDGGGAQAAASGMTVGEIEEYAEEYLNWVAINADRIGMAIEFDSRVMTQDWLKEHRKAMISEVGEDRFTPVWNHSLGHTALFSLSEMYPNIAIPGDSIEEDNALAGRTQAMVSRFGTKFHGLAVAKPDNLRSIPFTTASTLSWVSPMMRGETIVWDGSKLVRYPKKMKDQARPRYKAVVEQANLNFESIINDEPNEVVKLAVWSYLQLEKNVDRKRPNNHKLSDNSEVADTPESAETLGLPPDNSAIEVRKDLAVERSKMTPRNPLEMTTLPVLGVTSKVVTDYDPTGREVLREAPMIQSTGTSLRQCNTCFVAGTCPAFKENNPCAFSLPVEVKTKDQLRSLLNAIIEMQGARIAFARYAEELNGGYPDPNTSQEIDRLFKLVGKLKELEENREFIKMTVERQGAGGVLSAIFGEKAQSLKELPNGGLDESSTTRVISENFEN